MPRVPGLERIVRDQRWAIVLGKAMFWDQQAGSDGMACASCHFHAGADNRVRNQLSPSLNHLDPSRQGVFDPTRTGAGGPDYTLRAADFPFHVLSDPDDRESTVLFDLDDVVSSSGVFRAAFGSVGARTTGLDDCVALPDALFTTDGRNTRRVEPRNSPTVINAVFNFRNFWDGRANNVFNGLDPFGPRNRDGRVLLSTGRTVHPVALRLKNSSLASQAVGPPLSDFEMSCSGRSFPDVARKLLDRRALELQRVACDDSVLGDRVHPSGFGLDMTYAELIRAAFRPEWWSAPTSFRTTAGDTMMEHNFSMYWGLAVQLYESTLVSNRSPYDRFAEGDRHALSPAARAGLDVFLGAGKCVNCHKGPDFTGAGWVLQQEQREGGLIEHMLMGDGQAALYDSGFYNIGVRPTGEDLGLGGLDPWGNPLSFARQIAFATTGSDGDGDHDGDGEGDDDDDDLQLRLRAIDRLLVDPSTFEEPLHLSRRATNLDLLAALQAARDAIDGAFKTPGLRNVELTGPYFHNGGQATLEQVVEFYDRGGDRRRTSGGGNTTGFGPNRSNLDPDIESLGLSGEDARNLVAFLKALTDERVRWERAPFDHPALTVPHGHHGGAHPQLGPLDHADRVETLPAVGQGGRGAQGLPPLRPFHERLQ
ncbi:MAG: cytochrome c peroxidase [Planctomycetota bacterium]